jgi:hypothetical protein
MSFYTYCTGSSAVAFCFNTPMVLQKNLVEAMNAALRGGSSGDLMALLQCLIIAEVTKLYDVSIWTIRHEIRDIEKVGVSKNMLSAARLTGVGNFRNVLQQIQVIRHSIFPSFTTLPGTPFTPAKSSMLLSIPSPQYWVNIAQVVVSVSFPLDHP